MEKTFGCCRKVYNHYLEVRKTARETEKKRISGFDCMKDLTNLKEMEEFDYLRKVNAVSLQQSLRDLNAALNILQEGLQMLA